MTRIPAEAIEEIAASLRKDTGLRWKAAMAVVRAALTDQTYEMDERVRAGIRSLYNAWLERHKAKPAVQAPPSVINTVDDLLVWLRAATGFPYAAKDIPELETLGKVPPFGSGNYVFADWIKLARSHWPQVYFVQSGEDGPIKIGWARLVSLRMTDLRVGSPDELHIRATVPGTMAVEQRAHRVFAGLHIRGEWFKAQEPLLGIVMHMREKMPSWLR